LGVNRIAEQAAFVKSAANESQKGVVPQPTEEAERGNNNAATPQFHGMDMEAVSGDVNENPCEIAAIMVTTLTAIRSENKKGALASAFEIVS
jgi:hypothetical protein